MSDEETKNNPHPVNEDPEECIGDEIPDPWNQPDPWSAWADEQMAESKENK